MVNLLLNGRPVSCRPGTTILQLAARHGVTLPTLCHLPGHEARSVCRLCCVEVEGQERLLPACSTPVAQNMVIHTHSQRCQNARRVLMEFILMEHGGGASPSPQLRALAADLGVEMGATTAAAPAEQRRDDGEGRHDSDYIRVTQALCIHCDRCIAACRDRRVIARTGRGAATRLTFGTRDASLTESGCTTCGDCLSVCPTGALRERE